MLMPKRVKHRRVHRGRMKGVATKGNTITYGSFWTRCTGMRLDHFQSDRSCQNCNDKIYQERRKGLYQNLPSQVSDKEACRSSNGFR